MIKNSPAPTKTIEKQKKLLMKKLMNWIRLEFNSREIGFHLLLLCVSIKPGFQQRSSTLQSYPNKELWKALQQIFDQELLTDVIEKVREKAFKLKLNQSYQSELIEEFYQRILNKFDFQSFYKDHQEVETKDSNRIIQTQNDQHQDHRNEEKTESEAKQLLTQIKLCNTKGSIVVIENLHYHKLHQLLQKIQNYHQKQQSYEMRQFYQELVLFLQKSEPKLEKKVKPNNDEHSIILDDSTITSEYGLLEQTKQEVHKLEPGISLFMPKTFPSQELRDKFIKAQESFYKELYYLKRVNPESFNAKNILFIWRNFYEQQANPNILIIPNLCKQHIKIE